MRCRDALLSREHRDVRSDLARYDEGGVGFRYDVVLLNIQTTATINCQHLARDIGCVEAKIGHR